MKPDIRKQFLNHPVLGPMDAFFVKGAQPYLRTPELRSDRFLFSSQITIWTSPENPSDIAISGAANLVQSGDDFRAEVERRFFEDYITITHTEYLEYASDPAHGITPSMLREIHTPAEVWSFLRPKNDDTAAINEPDRFDKSQIAEVTLSFSVSFDAEHDFHIVFKGGKFYELTR